MEWVSICPFKTPLIAGKPSVRSISSQAILYLLYFGGFMKNPCLELITKNFEMFGYLTEECCDICGGRPARQEPRFLYNVCIHHHSLSPIRIGELILKKNTLQIEGSTTSLRA
jgi:hypothetical protein